MVEITYILEWKKSSVLQICAFVYYCPLFDVDDVHFSLLSSVIPESEI